MALVATSMSGRTAEDAAKVLFNQKCSSCRGKDGKGNPDMAKMFKLTHAELDLTAKAVTLKKEKEPHGLEAHATF